MSTLRVPKGTVNIRFYGVVWINETNGTLTATNRVLLWGFNSYVE